MTVPVSPLHATSIALIGDAAPAAPLVSKVALLVFSTTVLSMAAFPFLMSGPQLVVHELGTGAFALIYAVVWVLAQRGRQTAGAWTFVVGTLLGQVGIIWITGSLTEQAVVSVGNLVLATGFMLGRRQALTVGVVCTSALVTMTWLGTQGMLPLPIFGMIDSIRYVSLVMVLLTTAGLTYIGIEFMMDAVRAAQVNFQRASEAIVSLEEAREADGRRAKRAERLGILARNLVGHVEPGAFSQEVAIGLRDALNAWVVLIVGRGGHIHATAGLGKQEPPREVLPTVADQLVPQGSFRVLSEAHLEQLGRALGLEQPNVGLVARGPHNPITVLVLGRGDWLVPEEVQWPVQVAANLLDAAVMRFEAEGRLVQAQKMDALSRLSAGIAHDFNNLLTTILGGAELLEHRAGAADPIQGHLRRIRDAGERAALLTAKLMSFTRGAPRARQLVEVARLVSDLIPVLRRTLEESIEIAYHESEEVSWVDVDPIDLERIIFNLVANARDAVGAAGRIDIGLEVRPAEGEGSSVTVIWVQDNGEGMDLDVRTRVFEPFFTTRKGKGATGLGLSIVYGVAQAMGGDVFVDSIKGSGTCVEIHLPSRPEPEGRKIQAPPLAKPVAGSQVLVVEDDPDVRDTVCEMLILGGYLTVAVGSGSEALDHLNSGEQYCLVLSDVVMPSMSGFELASQMKAQAIETPIALISGYAPGGEEPDDVEDMLPRITKPFSLSDLLGFVAGCV
jgi:signal transduction histidine kinase/CheY-like chemotaxis protein